MVAADDGTRRPQAERQHFLADLAAGWREVASRSWAWFTLAGNAVSNAVAGPLQSAFGADRVLFGAGAAIAVANFAPAVLPAVRAVIRQRMAQSQGHPPGHRAAPVHSPIPEAPAVSD